MQITSLLQTNSVAPDPNRPAQKPAPRPSACEDQVRLSSQATQLAQLQMAYDTGTYNVSPSWIANSIINDAIRG